MYGTFYKTLDTHLMLLPVLALFVFLAVFAVIVLRALARPEAEVARDARLPLDRDDR